MKKQQKDKKVKKDRREKLRYIREVSAEQRGRILLSCLTGILGVAFALAFIYATKRVIDTATGITDDNLTHIAYIPPSGRQASRKPEQERRSSEALSGHQEEVRKLFFGTELRDRQVHRARFRVIE